MARIEINLDSGSKKTQICIERISELDAVTEAIGLLLASYGSDIRPALARLASVVTVIREYLPDVEADRD